MTQGTPAPPRLLSSSGSILATVDITYARAGPTRKPGHSHPPVSQGPEVDAAELNIVTITGVWPETGESGYDDATRIARLKKSVGKEWKDD